MIYAGIIIVCVVLVLLEQSGTTERLMPYLRAAAMLFMVIFVGLRFETGPDYDSYESSYLGRSDFRFESLFSFFMTFFRKLGAGYNLFLLFIATLSISIKYYTFNRYSPYFFLSCLLGCGLFLSDMGQIRYSLAISVLWLAIPFCLERRLVPYLLILLCAVFIHQTAIVFLPVYWLGNVKLNFPVMMGIWLACYVLSYTFIGDLSMDLLSEYAPTTTVEKLEVYEENQQADTRYLFSPAGILLRIGLLALIYYSNLERRLKLLSINICFLGGCFLFFFSFSEIYASRLSAYFLSFDALLIPLALCAVRDNWMYYTLFIMLIVKSVYQYIYQVYYNYPEMYMPYHNVLFN